MFHYYIYYRIDPEHTMEADAAVKQIQFEVEAEVGTQGRRLSKRSEPMLWMEIYESVASTTAFEAALDRAVDRSGLLQWLATREQRHVECFED